MRVQTGHRYLLFPPLFFFPHSMAWEQTRGNRIGGPADFAGLTVFRRQDAEIAGA